MSAGGSSLTVVMAALAALGLVVSCGEEAQPPGSAAEVPLPAPDTVGSARLEETIASRRSVRSYAPESLTSSQIGQLLWAAQGITGGATGRAAPSAGGLYPLELYVVSEDGVFRYRPEDHHLILALEGDVRDELAVAALDQEALHDAPAVFVVTAVYERTAAKYGDRAERYVQLEAGHAAQNLLLEAVALDLGAVPIGAFADTAVQEVLGLPADHAPLYLIPVGVPAG